AKSSASKLVHGGVRYLAQGHLPLVREALHERRRLLENAPHLVQPLRFVLPVFGLRGRLLDRWYYAAGLAANAALAGRDGLGPTRVWSSTATAAALPGVRRSGLAGGVSYFDAQFDDARLAIALARTAARCGGHVVNHCRVESLLRRGGRVAGVVARDGERGATVSCQARCVVNATGVFVDAVRRLDDPQAAPLVTPSQGVQLVVDRSFLPAEAALLVPRTADGRVLFAVPWEGAVILGTTDTPRTDASLEPRPLADEIDFILAEAGRVLDRPPQRCDVRSAWAGLRPLVRPRTAGRATRSISREHTIEVAVSGLVTVTGGKWTPYRAMAEDVLEHCMAHDLLPRRPAGVTRTLRLVAAPPPGTPQPAVFTPPGLHLYGTDAAAVAALPGADHELLPGFTAAMVRFAVREEFARSVEDVLARRSRWLFLDAGRAAAVAGDVAAIMADEIGPSFDTSRSAAAFSTLADGYRLGVTPRP
ncbi:MAG: glycerol-3-phosphate dehydrogenase/oxidase, partial [Planctomycetaceae bacterium]